MKLYEIKKKEYNRHISFSIIYSWVKVGEYVSSSSLQKHSQLRLTALKIKKIQRNVLGGHGSMDISEVKGISTNMKALSVQDG